MTSGTRVRTPCGQRKEELRPLSGFQATEVRSGEFEVSRNARWKFPGVLEPFNGVGTNHRATILGEDLLTAIG